MHLHIRNNVVMVLAALTCGGFLLAPSAHAAVQLQVVDSELDEPSSTGNYTELAPFDLDADGLPDVVSSGPRDGDYRYSRPTPDGMPNLDSPMSRPNIGGGDIQALNGLATGVVGGRPFLVQFDTASPVLDLFHRDDGTINSSDQEVLAANVVSVAIGEANGDGLPDVVALLANGAVSVIPVVPQGISFRFDTASTVSLGPVAGTPLTVRYADVSGSSLPDIVVLTGGAEERIRIATALSVTPTFSGFASANAPAGPRDLELADFDLDGRRDFLVGTTTGVSIARNENGAVGVTSSRPFNTIPDVTAGDVDGDGTLEVAAGMGSTVAVALLDVNGTTPGVPQTFDAVTGNETVLAVDLDGDGADEVVIAARSVDVLTNVSPGAVAANPTSAALGSVEVGRTGSPSQITLTNQREGPDRVKSVRVEGAAAAEVLAVDACTSFLAPGEQCAVTARLSPGQVGQRSAQLRVDFRNAPDVVIPVSGEGVAASPGPAGPPGPVGAQGPEGSTEILRAAVLTTANCTRKDPKVRCTLKLAEGSDVEGEVRLLNGRKTVGRSTLEQEATQVKVAGKVSPKRKSVVIELELPGLDSQRVTVPVKK